MAIQGSQDLSSITIRQPGLVAQDRDADYDAFSEVSDTTVLGDLPTVHNRVLVRCPTVADIPNLNLNDGDAVSLLGYYSVGDGGGQILIYDANSTATVNSGFVFSGPSRGRLLAVDVGEANALRWGVRPNDSTIAQATINNTQLQAALNSNAQSVYVPAVSGITSYYLTTGVTVPQLKLLHGGGWNTRVRPLNGTESGSVFVYANSYSSIQNIAFQGAPAAGGTSTGDGVVISGGATTVDFYRVYSLQWGNGFAIRNSYVITFNSCRASANLAAGIKLAQASCNAIQIVNCELQGNREGVDLGSTATQVGIRNCTIQGNTNYGVGRTANVINNAVTIGDNYFEANGRSHIRTESGIIMGGYIGGNHFAGTITLNPIYITRWDAVTLGPNMYAGSYSGASANLSATCINGVIFAQGIGSQSSGVVANVAHTTGSNIRLGF